jgi:SPP1 family predicted phage head-tail adaptor
MKDMNAGELKHRVEVQSKTDTLGDHGGPGETWATVGTRWAKIEPMRGTETQRSEQNVSDVTHKITLRYYPGLTPSFRLVEGSRVFHIESVINTDESDVMSVCECVEGVA